TERVTHPGIDAVTDSIHGLPLSQIVACCSPTMVRSMIIPDTAIVETQKEERASFGSGTRPETIGQKCRMPPKTMKVAKPAMAMWECAMTQSVKWMTSCTGMPAW